MAACRRAIVAAVRGDLSWLASRRIRLPIAILVVALTALLIAACGGSDDRAEGVSFTVTRDFGREQVDSGRVAALDDGETAEDVLPGAAGAPGRLFVNGVQPD